MDLNTIIFVNALLIVLGIAIFVAFHLLDRIIKRKFERKKERDRLLGKSEKDEKV